MPVVSYPQATLTYDSTTGQYIAAQPAAVTAQQMVVMVYDPVTRQYVQKVMAMVQDPVTGNFVPADQPLPPEQDPNAIAARRRVEEAERRRQIQEAERQRKQLEAEAKRRAMAEQRRLDQLRRQEQQRVAQRQAMVNRVAGTALNTASREITR